MSHFAVGVICEDPNELEHIISQYSTEDENYYEEIPYITKEDYLKLFKAEHPNTLLSDDAIWQTVANSYCLDPRHVHDDYACYYCNPQGLWDWYQFGGRWYGSLKVSKHAKHYMGDTPFGRDPISYRRQKGKYRKVDGALIKDILWDNMDILSIKEKKDLTSFWNNYVEGKNNEKKENNFNHPTNNPDDYKHIFHNKENFLKFHNRFYPYYLLIGPTGEIFSQDTEIDGKKSFQQVFDKIIKDPEYQDMWFFVVDCHM